jgi:2-haloacid dehalogenase
MITNKEDTEMTLAGKNKKYRFLLFDVDDTLMDFGAIEAQALQTLFESYGHPLSPELLKTYHTINRGLWADYERGQVAMGDMLKNRFSLTMSRFGIEADGAEWEKSYQALLGQGSHLIDGAIEVVGRLKASHRLFVVTNGVRETQRKRLEAAGLYGLFEAGFDSQSIGYQKPAKEFFDHVTGHIDGFDKRDALIIGDSLNTDIKGGIAAGIDTCWFNRYADNNGSQLPITYTITKLTELYGILGLEHEG